jgi:MOSC domain-containing protein YiiM
MRTLAELMAGPVCPGRVVWIGVRPARRVSMMAVAEATAIAGQGLSGDRHAERGRVGGARQVTLVAEEHLAAIGGFLGRGPVAPGLLRRNVVVRGANLLALKKRRFRVGDALLEATGDCHPCSRMEDALGPDGYNAMRGHGGITARVLEGGLVRLGDALAVEVAPGEAGGAG